MWDQVKPCIMLCGSEPFGMHACGTSKPSEEQSQPMRGGHQHACLNEMVEDGNRAYMIYIIVYCGFFLVSFL